MSTNGTSFAVRIAGPHDLAVLVGLHAGQGNRAPGPPTDLEQETWQRMLTTSGLTVYLAHDAADGAVVGTATTMLMPNITYACAPTLFVEAVLVRASHRRLGIARAMLRRALADARDAGANKVQLLSHKRHATDGAHGLYTSLGFDAEAEGFRLYLVEPPASTITAAGSDGTETSANRRDDG